jgi:hypothetical protein
LVGFKVVKVSKKVKNRASFGTTKYCSYFLRGIQCVNPECMYLHDYGDEEDTFNKEEIILQNGLPVPQDKGNFKH